MRRDPTERTMFIGNEVENTLAKGRKTLFVAGPYQPQEMLVQAKSHNVEQIYLAANQSYSCRTPELWARTIEALLDMWHPDSTYNIAIDVPAQEFPALSQSLKERGVSQRLLVQISVHVPKAHELPYVTYVKIDDDIRDVSNPGVWVWSLSRLTLMSNPNFTPWEAYKEDHVRAS